MHLQTLMRQLRARPALCEVGVATLTGLACVGLSYRIQGMHRGDFSLPDRDGDALLVYSLVKGMQQHGWYTPNPSLGYPFGQDLAPYPNLDLVHIMALKVASMLFDNPFGPVRLFDFWAFFAAGALMFVLLRYAGTRMLVAGPLAVTVSLAPWHFQRLTGHNFLADYSPLIVALLMALFTLRRIRASGGDTSLTRTDAAPLVALMAGGFYLAGGGLYWLFAGGIMIALTALPALAANRSWRGLAYSAAALLPPPIFAAAWLQAQSRLSSYPATVESFTREMIESELYGGSIATLFLGSPRSGLEHIAQTRGMFDSWTRIGNNWESGPWNGIVGVIAVTVAFLLLIATTSTLAADRLPRRGLRTVSAMITAPRRDGWYSLFLVSFLLFAVGGVGTLAMTYLFMEIRAWGRFFILVVIVATVILGLALTVLSRLRPGPWIALVMAASIAVLFVADQRGGGYRSDFVTRAAISDDAQAFTAAVEAAASPGCPVLTLPVMPYPENGPIGAMKDYDPLWLYVHSSDLRFTYGVPKNQPEAQWQNQFASGLTPDLLRIARDSGVCGISVDTYGYGGPEAPDVQALLSLTDQAPIWSPSRRWMFTRT